MSIPQAMENALQHHQAGRLGEAEAIYRQILAVDPQNADALHLLGVLAHQVGRDDIAVDLIRKAVLLQPNYSAAYDHLGSALRAMGNLDGAIVAYERAIALAPNIPDTHYNLGNALHDRGRMSEAVASYRRAVAIRPDYPDALCNLANTLQLLGIFDEAIALYHKSIALNSGSANAFGNLGAALCKMGRHEEAIVACRRAIALKPDYPEAHYNLAVSLGDQGDPDEAIAAYRRVIATKPDLHEAHLNLGAALRNAGQIDEAIAACEKAILLKPDRPEAYNNLANTLKDAGRFDEAISAYRKTLSLKAGLPDVHSNMLLTLHYQPGLDGAAIADEHRQWGRMHAEPLREASRPHCNDRSPNRRLRIGYVSADFRDHPVGRFLLALLAHHDHRDFEIFCYAQVVVPDVITELLRSHSDGWCSLSGLTSQVGAERIRADQIDILVDLSGHTANHSLLIFARKPAPIQVTWLGYPNTTGLITMDYRLTDGYADPEGITDRFHTEKLWRLPSCAWCYEPNGTLEMAPARTGPITFGCFNNFAKVTQPMCLMWARILHAVPDSRLLLKARSLGNENARRRVLNAIAGAGIGPERLELRGYEPDEGAHLALYERVDIALDTFPYHGTTTTCEALWMGVPVVSLAGRTHASRVGVSLLSNVGLPELVASSEGEYIQIAVQLANDRRRLNSIRCSLRGRMEKSPLMDAPRFARDMEAAYRDMWKKWCVQRTPEPTS